MLKTQYTRRSFSLRKAVMIMLFSVPIVACGYFISMHIEDEVRFYQTKLQLDEMALVENNDEERFFSAYVRDCYNKPGDEFALEGCVAKYVDENPHQLGYQTLEKMTDKLNFSVLSHRFNHNKFSIDLNKSY